MIQRAQPTDLFPQNAIPADEIEQTVQLIRSHPNYASTSYMIEAYTRLGLKVVPDPWGRDIADLAIEALRTQTPLSIVRMGDGEMNILSFDTYATPYLDRFCLAASVQGQEDSFIPDESWMIALREMLISAVLQADVVGVLGLWRTRQNVAFQEWIDRLRGDLRGISGHWRGLDHMLRAARTGLLNNKVVTSAHLYFGLLDHLEEIVARAARVLLITSKPEVFDGFRKKFPGCSFDHLRVGRRGKSDEPLPDAPRFLQTVAAQLPQDLRGCCCLVGAGPWAEIYCSWIKQRGGVGLDLGSGFDLLNGTVSRPVHTALGMDRTNPYSLATRLSNE